MSIYLGSVLRPDSLHWKIVVLTSCRHIDRVQVEIRVLADTKRTRKAQLSVRRIYVKEMRQLFRKTELTIHH